MGDHNELIELLHAIKDLATETRDQAKATNGRVNKLEVAVGVLKWAVFGVGGPAMAWLLLKHVSG